MVDNVESLVLGHLKRFQVTLDRVERRQDEMTGRIANLEGSTASIIRHLGDLASADAAQQLSADNINRRLDRIERRLELSS